MRRVAGFMEIFKYRIFRAVSDRYGVDIINRQTSKHYLVMIYLLFIILFRARHIPGVHNSGADYISRFQVEQFKQISPEADVPPTPLPAYLLPQSWFLR